jgi:hypothetical protein
MSNRNNYAKANSFGCSMPDPVNNPLSYCVLGANVNNKFLHGGYANEPFGKECQAFMSDYCAQGWDDFCEVASAVDTTSWPNSIDPNSPMGLTQGEILIRNTAAKKYLIKTYSSCQMSCEPFDPTVTSSPMVCYNCNCPDCVPQYEVNPETIDKDIVMNKILNNYGIASDMLVNIYENMARKGLMVKLEGTNLGGFYKSREFMELLQKHNNKPWRP